jgi:hypothetical protein
MAPEGGNPPGPGSQKGHALTHRNRALSIVARKRTGIVDAMERLTGDSEIVVGVLGRGERFVLVPLNDAEPTPDLDAVYTVLHASLAFAQQVADKLKGAQEDDFVRFATRLYALQDPRPYV